MGRSGERWNRKVIIITNSSGSSSPYRNLPDWHLNILCPSELTVVVMVTGPICNLPQFAVFFFWEGGRIVLQEHSKSTEGALLQIDKSGGWQCR